jgi:hypothetical protein
MNDEIQISGKEDDGWSLIIRSSRARLAIQRPVCLYFRHRSVPAAMLRCVINTLGLCAVLSSTKNKINLSFFPAPGPVTRQLFCSSAFRPTSSEYIVSSTSLSLSVPSFSFYMRSLTCQRCHRAEHSHRTTSCHR